MKKIIVFAGLAALLAAFVACGGGEPMPDLPNSLAGFAIGDQFVSDGPGWTQNDFGELVAWERKEGLGVLQVMCDENGRIKIVALNMMLHNESTGEGGEAEVKKYQDEIWDFKTTYAPIHIGQDRGGNEAFVGDRIVLTVNIYKEGASGATRYIKTIKTRAIHDQYNAQR